MKDLTRRLTVASVTIVLLVLLLVFAFNPWFQYVIASLVALLAGIGVWEYGQFVKAKGGRIVLPVLISLTGLVVFSFFLSAQFVYLNSLPLIALLLSFLTLFSLHFKQNEGAVVDLSVSSFGLFYIAIPIGMSLGILYWGANEGRFWLIYLLIITKITDAGAYFAGNLWGKRKLAPTISPGKTVEGAFFGLFCAVVASFFFYLYGTVAASQPFQHGAFESLLLGLILGVVAQFGDLSESLLKRDANKKDSNALPGLGGVLDLVDSLLFNAPILYIYLRL